MSTFKCLVAVVGWLVAAQPSFADDREKVIGIWKLVSQEIEIQASGQKEPVMGRSPTGYAIFTPEGRVMFVLTGEGRKPPQTVQDRADLLNSMAAYTGMYRLEGDKWITQVDVAWNPEWVGTEQTRFFKLDGDRLHVTSTWRIMPNWADKGMRGASLCSKKRNRSLDNHLREPGGYGWTHESNPLPPSVVLQESLAGPDSEILRCPPSAAVRGQADIEGV
jgi:hypothetical protein